jgi:hypothetical protein
VNRSRRIRLLAVALLSTSLVAPLAARSVTTASAPVFRKISTTVPAWYTREVQQKVVAAGPRGLTIPSEYSIATSSLAFLGIRPGQLILVSNGSLCTTNFVFRNGANYAIGTAGHCGAVGDQVTMLTAPRVLVDIGTITKSTGDAGPGNDFALISINPALNSIVSPSMAFWGGPSAPYAGTQKPLIVRHIGWGLVIGTGGTPRIGVGISYLTSGEWRFEGAVTPGDSGSGAISGDKTAVGNITHSVINSGRLPVVWFAGTSIPRILQIAGLPLATCASTIPWPLYGCPRL